jgi:hypothetical protein
MSPNTPTINITIIHHRHQQQITTVSTITKSPTNKQQ